MSKIALLMVILLFAVVGTFAQLSFDKPKVEGLLPNPYNAPAARDVVVEASIAMIKDMNIDLDKEKSRQEEGILVAKPVIFTKGTVTVSQLEHFAHCPAVEARNWTRGRYTLQMVIEPVDPSHAKINISAKIEGEIQGMIGNSWVDCPSNGLLENQILAKIIERIK